MRPTKGQSVSIQTPLQTIAAIHTFTLSMLLHPHVMKKAQEEMDSAVGPDRLLTVDDRPSLPYFECVMKEALR